MTDTPGKQLAEAMGLPFQSVSTSLDGMSVSPMAWAAGKLVAYSQQTKPFIHLDQDVFLFNRLPASIESAPLCVQSFEGPEYYFQARHHMTQEEWGRLTLPAERWQAVNAGILGGQNVSLLREYADEAMQAIRQSEVRSPNTMVVFEQAFFSRKAADKGVPITPLLTELSEAESLGYVHLMHGKEQVQCMDRVRRRLMDEDPGAYSRAVLASR